MWFSQQKCRSLPVLFFLSMLSVSLHGQLSISTHTGFMVDFDDTVGDKDVVLNGWQGVRHAGVVGNKYLSVEVAYSLSDKQDVGLRYNFNGRSIIIHKGDELKGYSGAVIYGSLDASAIYRRQVAIINSLNFSPVVGLGVEADLQCDCLGSKGYKLDGRGYSRIITEGVDYYYTRERFQRNAFRIYAPLEANLDYKFNEFLVFVLNVGYELTLNRKSIYTGIDYFKNEAKQGEVREYQTDIAYAGIGMRIILPRKKK